jgi:hypothetical protein
MDPFPGFNRTDWAKRRKFQCAVVDAFDGPVERTKLATVREGVTLVLTGIGRGIDIVPPTGPIIVEIRVYGIALWRDAGVMPEKLLAGRFPDQVINLGPHLGQYTDRQTLVLQSVQLERMKSCLGKRGVHTQYRKLMNCVFKIEKALQPRIGARLGSTDPWFVGSVRRSRSQEIEVTSLVSLKNMLHVHRVVPAWEAMLRRAPLCQPALDFLLRHHELQISIR